METFDGYILKMKAVAAIYVIQSKKQYFQLCLGRTCTLIFSLYFFLRPKYRRPRKKIIYLFNNLKKYGLKKEESKKRQKKSNKSRNKKITDPEIKDEAKKMSFFYT